MEDCFEPEVKRFKDSYDEEDDDEDEEEDDEEEDIASLGDDHEFLNGRKNGSPNHRRRDLFVPADDESNVDSTDIDTWLEESFEAGKVDKPSSQASSSPPPDPEAAQPELVEKIVLRVPSHGKDHFEVLPEGWVEITHNSGMPVFLHKDSRVCSLAKPYFLGPASARKHDIPLSAVPCLQYRKAVEKEKEALCQAKTEPVEPQPSDEPLPDGVRIENYEELKKETSLDSKHLREYCEKLFEFKRITVPRFKSWKERRTYNHQNRPQLPSSTKLIACRSKDDRKKECVINIDGKSSVCILHEYVQNVYRQQPHYIYDENADPKMPHRATVKIQQITYGTGVGSSKKAAKLKAAEEALKVLFPGFYEKASPTANRSDCDYSVFDAIRITDERVQEMCFKAGQPSPYAILVECLKRNFGIVDPKMETAVTALRYQKSQFAMTLGGHTATVVCKNKRDGKQKAAQQILQDLHPNLECWGSLLRLYSKTSNAIQKERKDEELKITQLKAQTDKSSKKPNYLILEKLKEEMGKVRHHPELLDTYKHLTLDFAGTMVAQGGASISSFKTTTVTECESDGDGEL